MRLSVRLSRGYRLQGLEAPLTFPMAPSLMSFLTARVVGKNRVHMPSIKKRPAQGCSKGVSSWLAARARSIFFARLTLLLCPLDAALGLCSARAHGLFAEDVLAGIEAEQYVLLVEGVRRRHVDNIHIFVGH